MLPFPFDFLQKSEESSEYKEMRKALETRPHKKPDVAFLHISFPESHFTGGYLDRNSLGQPLSKEQSDIERQ